MLKITYLILVIVTFLIIAFIPDIVCSQNRLLSKSWFIESQSNNIKLSKII